MLARRFHLHKRPLRAIRSVASLALYLAILVLVATRSMQPVVSRDQLAPFVGLGWGGVDLTDCVLCTVYCVLYTAYYLLLTVNCLLHIRLTYCPLPTAHCTLPTTHYPLPITHYPLPTIHDSLIIRTFQQGKESALRHLPLDKLRRDSSPVSKEHTSLSRGQAVHYVAQTVRTSQLCRAVATLFSQCWFESHSFSQCPTGQLTHDSSSTAPRPGPYRPTLHG